MQIINETGYLTSDLRTRAVRIAREELTPEKSKQAVVTFGYRRSSIENFSTSGFACLGGYKCRINLSRYGVDQIDLALTLAHEFAHLRGLVHRQMQNAQYRRMGKWRAWYAWAAAYPVRKRPAPSQAAVLIQKLHNAQRMWAKSQRKTATLIKRRARRVRYYTSRLEKIRAFALGEAGTLHANGLSLGKIAEYLSTGELPRDSLTAGRPRAN